MDKDKFEGGVRSAVGQGESFVGASTDDKASEVKGAYDQVAGSAQTVGRSGGSHCDRARGTDGQNAYRLPVRFATSPSKTQVLGVE
jgi:uncharacterized protein YjbJ (UPF0337 family)